MPSRRPLMVGSEQACEDVGARRKVGRRPLMVGSEHASKLCVFTPKLLVAVPSWSGRNGGEHNAANTGTSSRRPLMVGSERVASLNQRDGSLMVAVPSWSGRNSSGSSFAVQSGSGRRPLMVGSELAQVELHPDVRKLSPSPHGRVGTLLEVRNDEDAKLVSPSPHGRVGTQRSVIAMAKDKKRRRPLMVGSEPRQILGF